MSGEIDLLEEISALVDSEWASSQLPLPLSSLGSRLTEGAKTIVRAQNISLSRYIQEHLSDKIRIVPMRKYGGGVAPKADTEAMSDAELERRYENRPQRVHPPQYFSSVWKAFRSPLPEGQKRYLLVREGRRTDFIDVASEADTPDDGLEVPSSAIVDPRSLKSVQQTVAAIQDWAERNNVAPQLVAFSEKERGRDAGAGNFRESDRLEIDGAFAYLTPDELARISIPGDVFFAALKRAAQRRR